MGFFNIFKSQDVRLKKHTIKSGKDLGISSSCLFYIEKEYDTVVNKYISRKYNSISKKVYKYYETFKLIYLPKSVENLFDNQGDMLSLLKYNYPNIKIGSDYFNKVRGVVSTPVFTNLAFSLLEYDENITPGFLRFVEKIFDGQEYNYIYEYTQLDLSSGISFKKQVNYCIETCFESKPYYASSDFRVSSQKKRRIYYYGSFTEGSGGSFSRYYNYNKKSELDKTKKKTTKYELKDVFEIKDNTKDVDEFSWKEFETHVDKADEEAKSFVSSKKQSKQNSNFNKKFLSSLFEEDETEDKKEEPVKSPALLTLPTELKKKESELIARIREDIMTVKAMGLLDLLIKEVGPALYEDREKIHKPSRLVVDEYFKIFLPDFDNMEIKMTTLPKTLFILFLRHSEGIILKHIHVYRKELLEIYKLLSYKEDYEDFVENIDRICNPTDGSINEKISRIKEAFLNNMSIDTAKHYIITGERGQKKEIILSRSLLLLPQMFAELYITITK